MNGSKKFILGALAVFSLSGLLAHGCAHWQRDPGPILEREAFAALREMVDAYESRNLAAFRSGVSGAYAGGVSDLERSVIGAFNRHARIQLRVSLSGAALSTDRRRVSLSLEFVRQLTPAATGLPVSEQGGTTVTMLRTRDGWKLLSQGSPPLF